MIVFVSIYILGLFCLFIVVKVGMINRLIVDCIGLCVIGFVDIDICYICWLLDVFRLKFWYFEEVDGLWVGDIWWKFKFDDLWSIIFR